MEIQKKWIMGNRRYKASIYKPMKRSTLMEIVKEYDNIDQGWGDIYKGSHRYHLNGKIPEEFNGIPYFSNTRFLGESEHGDFSLESSRELVFIPTTQISTTRNSEREAKEDLSKILDDYFPSKIKRTLNKFVEELDNYLKRK